VTIRSKEDLLEVWSNIKKGGNIILWCNGLKVKSTSREGAMSNDSSEDDDEEEVQETVKKKRKRASKIEEEEVGEPAKKRKKGEDKDKKVQTTISQLTGKHDKSYTPMQYRVWAEMYLGGVHPSLDTPPTSTMFSRAGGGGSVKKKVGQEVVSAISDLTSGLTLGSSLSLDKINNLIHMVDGGIVHYDN
jgi:hypothetical protein